MKTPVTEPDRKAHAIAHDDVDLAAVRDVLGYYNTRAYSLKCAEDLAILIKRARGDAPRRNRKGQLTDG